MKKSFLCVMAFVFFALLYTTSVSASEIGVTLDNVVSEETVNIDFDTVVPTTIENSTVVPLRKFCESAGLEVSWSDLEKTAYVKLKASAQSMLPIEQYAYRLLMYADTKGLVLNPESIIVTMTVGDPTFRLIYNYTDSEGDVVSVDKRVEVAVPATILSSGSIVVPVRGLMEAFGLWVEWSNNTVIVSIPPFDIPADGLGIVPAFTFVSEPEPEDSWYGMFDGLGIQNNWLDFAGEQVQAVVQEPGMTMPEGAEYLGNFRISHYCTCSKCCGKWGNATAWAGEVVPGYTIAVDPKVIPKLSTVYIEGYGVRRAEDCGSAIKGNRIDVAVSSHSEALKLGVVYKDVWLVK